VKPLSRLFRGKFLAYLREAFAEHRLEFFGQLRELAHPARFSDFVGALYLAEWVVYCKPAFGGPRQVLQYLARYTHRVAISNGDCWDWIMARCIFAGAIPRTTIK